MTGAPLDRAIVTHHTTAVCRWCGAAFEIEVQHEIADREAARVCRTCRPADTRADKPPMPDEETPCLKTR